MHRTLRLTCGLLCASRLVKWLPALSAGVATCKQLWKGISERYKQGLLYSDFWVTQFSAEKAYQSVLSDEHHQAVSKATSLTSHVERFNNTLRQRLARFARKTLAFSKSEHRTSPGGALAGTRHA